MIVAIALLALVVVFMAQKPVPGNGGTALPNPDVIPSTGTDGIPSPAKAIDPLMGTEAAQVVMDANPTLASRQPLLPPPPMPGGGVVRGSALSGADLTSKNLIQPAPVRTVTRADSTQRLLGRKL